MRPATGLGLWVLLETPTHITQAKTHSSQSLRDKPFPAWLLGSREGLVEKHEIPKSCTNGQVQPLWLEGRTCARMGSLTS